MRETLFVALGAGALGATVATLLVGAASGVGSDARAPFSEREMAAALDSTLGRRLVELQREVSGLRTDLAAVRREPADRSDAAAAPDAAAVPATEHRRARQHASAPERAEVAGVPEPDFERLKEMETWNENREVRRRWLLADEKDVLAWLGKPDSISTGDGYETWEWQQDLGDTDGDGEKDYESFTLRFVRGRLIGP